VAAEMRAGGAYAHSVLALQAAEKTRALAGMTGAGEGRQTT
jgi:hypothetical protein